MRSPSSYSTQNLPLVIGKGTLANPAIRFGSERTGLYFAGALRIGVSVGGFRAMEITNNDVFVRSNTAGAGNVSPLAIARANATTANGQLTAIDMFEVSAPAGRLAVYRQTATKSGWRMYGSTNGALNAFATLEADADGNAVVYGSLTAGSFVGGFMTGTSVALVGGYGSGGTTINNGVSTQSLTVAGAITTATMVASGQVTVNSLVQGLGYNNGGANITSGGVFQGQSLSTQLGATIGGALAVTGAITGGLGSTIGGVSLNTNVSIPGNLTVAGAIGGGNGSVIGGVTLNAGAISNPAGNITFGSGLIGGITLNANSVSGSGNVAFSGFATFSSYIRINGALSGQVGVRQTAGDPINDALRIFSNDGANFAGMGMLNGVATGYLGVNGAAIAYFSGAAMVAHTDAAMNLGSQGTRWATIYSYHYHGVDRLTLGLGAVPPYTTGAGWKLELSTDSAGKPGTSTWNIVSDIRSKDPESIKPYQSGGLAAALKMRPIRYRYNGEFGTPTDGVEYVGLSADDVRKVAPDMVRDMEFKPIETDTQRRSRRRKPQTVATMNYHNLFFVLLDSVKELNARLEALEKS
jgi:hypothetical protein